jgi:hypothetical protein
MEEDVVVKRKRTTQTESRASSSKFLTADVSLCRSPNKENFPVALADGPKARIDEPYDPVTQEDGYITPSPSPSSRHFTPELSSPLLPRTRSMPTRRESSTQDLVTQDHVAHVLVRGSSEPAPERGETEALPGPDLFFNLDDEDEGPCEPGDEAAAWNEQPELEDCLLEDEDADTATPPSSIENTQQ